MDLHHVDRKALDKACMLAGTDQFEELHGDMTSKPPQAQLGNLGAPPASTLPGYIHPGTHPASVHPCSMPGHGASNSLATSGGLRLYVALRMHGSCLNYALTAPDCVLIKFSNVECTRRRWFGAFPVLLLLSLSIHDKHWPTPRLLPSVMMRAVEHCSMYKALAFRI